MSDRCTTHPHNESLVSCGHCGTRICGRCVVATEVGTRCRACAPVRSPIPGNSRLGHGAVLAMIALAVLVVGLAPELDRAWLGPAGDHDGGGWHTQASWVGPLCEGAAAMAGGPGLAGGAGDSQERVRQLAGAVARAVPPPELASLHADLSATLSRFAAGRYGPEDAHPDRMGFPEWIAVTRASGRPGRSVLRVGRVPPLEIDCNGGRVRVVG